MIVRCANGRGRDEPARKGWYPGLVRGDLFGLG